MMAGIKPDLVTMYGVEILESVETPGLGGEIAGDRFKDQFGNISLLPKIGLVKQGRREKNEIQAVTGATISSQSVVNILNEKIARLVGILKR